MSTIQKRSNNTYTITVSLGYGADGKQIRRTKTIEADSKLTPKQIEKYVQQEAALFEAECRQGLVLNGNIKLQDFIENEWLPHKKRELKRIVSLIFKLTCAIIVAWFLISKGIIQMPH